MQTNCLYPLKRWLSGKARLKVFFNPGMFSFLAVIFLWYGFTSVSVAATFKTVQIQSSGSATEVEKNVVNLLSDRLKELGMADVQVTFENPSAPQNTDLIILLGIPQNHEAISSFFKKQHIQPLSELEPGPEGFLLKKNENQNIL